MEYRRIGLVLPLRVTRYVLRVAGFAFLIFFNPHLATRNTQPGIRIAKLATLISGTFCILKINLLSVIVPKKYHI
jgi:hypothetical protein